jgi:hypothetical protein
MRRRLILHLCADIGSDSHPYACDPRYRVVRVGREVGVQHYVPPRGVHGIIANPVCTAFSIDNAAHAGGHHTAERERLRRKGLWMVRHCIRIIRLAQPAWWVLENPATGSLRRFLGRPDFVYEPWQYGSPWTKRTALWGNFVAPAPRYTHFDDVPLNPKLYTRPNRRPSLAFLHKSAIHDIPEFAPFIPLVHTDSAFRSLCSQQFARRFFRANP